VRGAGSCCMRNGSLHRSGAAGQLAERAAEKSSGSTQIETEGEKLKARIR